MEFLEQFQLPISSQKRELSDDKDNDDEEWWQSFCSTPDKKEKEEPMEIPTQTAVDKDDNKKDDNKKDDNDEDEDEGKAELFVRAGKNKGFKYY